MDTPEDQLRHLKMRVRNLERSLAESEALSLEQIECTHRLEQQLFEAQAHVESHQQALASCRQENQDLGQRPTQADLDRHISHIQELQHLIWDLERRPPLEQVRILQQQVETGQAEIEMLKLELGRRVDPERFYQLQRELTELKNYANQLGDYAARLPQIQLQHAQSQLQSHQFETEIAELKEKLKEMEHRPTPAEVETQIQALQDQYQSSQSQLQHQLRTAQFQIEQLQTHLSIAESEREALLQELSDQSYAGTHEDQRIPILSAEIEQLRAQVAETDQLQAELQVARKHLEDLEQRPSLDQVVEWETQFQHLHQQITELRAQRDQLQAELEQRPSPAELETLQDQIQYLHSQCQEAEAYQQQLQAEIDQRPDPETMTHLHQQIEQMRTEWQAAQTQQQQLQQEIDQRPQPEEVIHLQAQIEQLQDRLGVLEAENRHLAQRPELEQLQEAQRRQELAEAHHVVSKKQIDKLQRQIDALKAECVQAHAYAQTQEKEVALLEQQKQELQDQLIVLTQHQAAQSQAQPADQNQRDLAPARSNGSPRAPITVMASETETHPQTQAPVKPRPSNPERIPTFSVDREEDPTPDLLRRHSLYKLSSASKSQTGSSQPQPSPQSASRPRSPRVDLPSFVRRSPL